MSHSAALSAAPNTTLRPVAVRMRTIIAGMIRPMTPKVKMWTGSVPTSAD